MVHDYIHPARHRVLPSRAAVREAAALRSRSRRLRAPDSASAAGTAASKLPWFVALFLLSMAMPWMFSIGSLRISIYRLVLLALIVPCTWLWATGRAGRIRIADLAVTGYCLWASLSLLVVHGPAGGIEPSGILFAETMGAYLVARCFIRTVDDFKQMVKCLFIVVVIVSPFAVIETLTGDNLLLAGSGSLLPTYDYTPMLPRFGLTRVQGPFEHPILFGVFCSSILAMSHLALGTELPWVRRWAMTAVVVFTAALSLSAGPMSALAAQGVLLVWNWTLRNFAFRWKLLWLLAVLFYAVVELGSNQSAAQFYISRFSFDQQSAGFRLVIWEFGTQSVANHPLFGTGLGDWDHPAWMPPSIDMFWLIHAIRHGIPAAVLMLLAFGGATLAVAQRRFPAGPVASARTAYLIVMTGFFIVGWTVHFWNACYALFMFLLGSGMWLLDADGGQGDAIPVRRLQSRRAELRSARA